MLGRRIPHHLDRFFTSCLALSLFTIMGECKDYNYTRPRGPIAAMYHSPGPIYGLPGLVGQKSHDPRSVHYKGPAYPFGVRHGKFRDDCSPGPCYKPNGKLYRDGMDGTPHYSLYSRPKDSSTFKPPGPGAYQPERSGQSAYPREPAYSFGLRHRNRRTDDTPGWCKTYRPHTLNNYVIRRLTEKTRRRIWSV